MDLGISGIEHQSTIGRGSFSVVYRATQSALARDVAVKVLVASSTDAKVRDAFLAECRALARLSSAADVVSVFDAGWTSFDQPYLVMPYMAGGTVQHRLDNGERFTLAAAMDVAVPLLTALGAAHAAGIIHRDVKPSNIFVDADGSAHLGDFGIASVLDLTTSATTAFAGTPQFAPPEAFAGAPADPRRDVYSAAATLRTLLIGRTPFSRPGSDVLGVIHAVSNDAPAPLPDDLPRGVIDALDTAMAKDPEARQQSAAQLLDELQAATRDLGTAAALIPAASLLPLNAAGGLGDAADGSGPGTVHLTGHASLAALSDDDELDPIYAAPLGPRANRRSLMIFAAAVAAALLVVTIVTVSLLRSGPDGSDDDHLLAIDQASTSTTLVDPTTTTSTTITGPTTTAGLSTTTLVEPSTTFAPVVAGVTVVPDPTQPPTTTGTTRATTTRPTTTRATTTTVAQSTAPAATQPSSTEPPTTEATTTTDAPTTTEATTTTIASTTTTAATTTVPASTTTATRRLPISLCPSEATVNVDSSGGTQSTGANCSSYVVGLDESGEYIEWTLPSNIASQRATVSVRYANNSDRIVGVTVSVNGTSAGSLSLSDRTSWTSWATVGRAANISGGARIRIAFATGSGSASANIDQLIVS